jgi:DnaJ-class molecular chaperone
MEMKTCPVCGGDGECVTSHRWTCYDCQGTGKVQADKYDVLLKQEKKVQQERDARLSAWEHRKMGG